MTTPPGSVPAPPPPSSPASKKVPRPWWALVVCLGAIASLGAGTWVYTANAPQLSIVAVELGGHGQRWPLPSGTSLAIAWDYAFIAGYGLALWLGTTAARWVFWSPRAAALARLGRGATVVVVVADLIENLCLTVALSSSGPGRSTLAARALDAAATAATIKFTVLVPAAALAIVGVAAALGRLLSSTRRHKLWEVNEVRLPTATEEPPSDPSIGGAPAGTRRARARTRLDSSREGLHQRLYRTIPSPGTHRPPSQPLEPASDQPRWRHAFNVPDIEPKDLEDRKPWDDVTGFCLSGGGIRSGSVAMGALQTLRTELCAADYLVSISGGGYTSGALAQLLTDAGDGEHVTAPGSAVHDAKQAYGPGSVELDHVRRHSSYIATTATQMLVAMAVLARGLLASLLLLFAPAVAIGVAAAWFYRAVPLGMLPLLPPQIAKANDVGVTTTAAAAAGLTLPISAVLAVAVMTGLALLAWVLQMFSGSVSSVLTDGQQRKSRWSSSGQQTFQWSNLGKRTYLWATRASVFLTQIAVITTVGAVGIPTLVWACGRIVAPAGGSPNIGAGAGGSLGAVLLTYLAAIASIVWRKRTTVQKVTGAAAGKGTGPTQKTAIPNGLLQLLLVIVSVGVLCLSWLLLLGVATVGTSTDLAAKNPAPSIWYAIVALFLIVVIGALFDESSLSLHPFYRRRLASAFATRVVTVPDPEAGNESRPQLVAVPYHPREQTPLSRYARPAESARPFPKFIFAAAASLTGQEATPPGLTAVSFTMSEDWVGGPDIGWVQTATLEKHSPVRLQRDLTVQGAVAISGAAFASAIGRFASWYQIILAVSGARLGAWLPNPMFLSAMRAARDGDGRVTDWTLPGLPRIRRGTYLLRELFNIHPQQERLLQVTDGGHYENLGIVELLRRRCSTIYCIDGGGDTPPTAPGLAEAIALAETELGVQIVLNDPLAAEPGAGRPLVPEATLAGLNATLTREPVITGTIHYPSASGLPVGSRTGVIYIAKALLWPTMPYSLLSYAAQNPVFPHDSTSDQWFDDGQFTAYTQLGRELGKIVKQVKEQPVISQDGHLAPDGVPAPANLHSTTGGGSR
jgi:hypothetical protein